MPPRPHRLICALLLLAACREQDKPSGLWGELLAVAAEAGEGETQRREAEEELGRIVRKLSAGITAGRVAALNAVMFDELGFIREVDRPDAGTMLLPPVLRNRRGTCVGLGTLYLAAAERLGWPAQAVMVPGHFFVAIQDGGRWRRVELLRRGEEMPGSWYTQKYGVPAGGHPAYLRALSTAEVRAVLRFNLGNEQREAGRLGAAEAAYRQAIGDFPGFPEAHANLGLTLHLGGRLPEARASYQQAQRLHPTLPGLASNLEAIDRRP
jgi:regulator of sirC expression with transglutaminase-like and TPR domain